MRGAKIALLLAAVIFLGAGYFFLLHNNEPEEDVPLVAPPVAYTLAARAQSDVARITVTRGGESRVFARGAAIADLFLWYVESEPDWVLDALRVQEFLFAAFHMTAAEKIHETTADMDLAEFGFNPPLATFTTQYTHGASATIHLGNLTPDHRHFFFMQDGDDAMYLVPYIVGARMLMDMGELLSRTIPPLRAEGITHFRVAQRGREPMTLVTGLEFLSPASIEGLNATVFYLNRFLLDDFNEAFRLGQAVALSPHDLTPFGLHDPFLELFYEATDSTLHVLFGDAFIYEGTTHIYVKLADRPHVFAKDMTAVNLLTDLNPMQFMTRFIALVPIAEVAHIEITRVYGEDIFITINNDPNPDSNHIAPVLNGVAIDAPTFRVLYRMLVALSADASIPPAVPAGTPEVVVTYFMLDGTQTVIEFFAHDANFYAFSVNGEDLWAVTNRRGLEAFFAEAARLT